MKVALILERFNLSLGGAERSTWEIARQLETMGIQTTILAATSSDSSDRIVSLCGKDSQKRISFSAYQQAVKKHLDNHSYDLVHSTLPFDFSDIYHPMGGSYKETYLRNADSYSGRLKPLWKKWTHALNRRRAIPMQAEERLCRQGQTAIAALSHYVKRQFIEHFQVPEDRIFLVPNGVETGIQVSPEQSEAAWGKISSGLKIHDRDQATVLLFGANNFRLKGLGDLLSAMALFVQTNPPQRLALVIAGTGNPKRYRKQARKLGIERDVFFYGYTDNIHPLLSACDAAVLPSYYDPCSRYILEALAAEKPVLTTRFNGASEYYEHRKHGIILDTPKNHPSFAEGLGFLSQPQNRQAASAAIRDDRLIEKVSIENHCQKITEMYDTLVKNQKRSL